MLKFFLRKLNSLLFLKANQGLNRLVTIYVNVTLFPLKDALKFPILIYGKCYVTSLRGKIQFEGTLRRGMLIIGQTDPTRSFESSSLLNIMGNIYLKEQAWIRRGLHLQVNQNASLHIGKQTFIADNATIICSKDISIGDNCRIGNNCVFMDTDFHYVIHTETKKVSPCALPVIIGQNCWIAGFNVIKKGAKLPEGTIVAGPYSMIGKDYMQKVNPYSIIGGCPAKLISENYRRINNDRTQQFLHDYFKRNNGIYQFPPERDIDNICLPQ